MNLVFKQAMAKHTTQIWILANVFFTVIEMKVGTTDQICLSVPKSWYLLTTASEFSLHEPLFDHNRICHYIVQTLLFFVEKAIQVANSQGDIGNNPCKIPSERICHG